MCKHLFICLFALLSFAFPLVAQQGGAVISVENKLFDFGTFPEEKGPVSHTFVVKNTGNQSLVIQRVSVSCGCMQPEWTKSPIPPNGQGEVTVTYQPKGRPGPFNKAIVIYSNSAERHTRLMIKGYVTPASNLPKVIYPYSVGPLKIHTRSLTYSIVYEGQTGVQNILMRNEGDEPITVEVSEHPEYLTIQPEPATLQPDETGEIEVSFDASKLNAKGREMAAFRLQAGENSRLIAVSANVVEDFGALTPAQREKSPTIDLPKTIVDFGVLTSKGSFLGIGGRTTESFVITNKGKSPLHIYSITSESEDVTISGWDKTVQPGRSTTVKASVRPNDITTKLETLIYIVCNDPNGPVRIVKVMAEKEHGTSGK